jgi:hypothetical protein
MWDVVDVENVVIVSGHSIDTIACQVRALSKSVIWLINEWRLIVHKGREVY